MSSIVYYSIFRTFQPVQTNPENNPMHECNLVIRPQNNMNFSTDCNIKNHMGNNGHDVNVNRVQSPIRSDIKFNCML